MIPAELRDRAQWVGWRYETRKDKRTKVPVSHGRRASSTDSSTWLTYREAIGDIASEGVGFVFSECDPYVGVDMDNCVGTTGALHPAAWQVVHDLNGYVEFSPSGHGLHIIVRGRIERGRRTAKTEWGGDIEIYASGRYFTVSGNGRGEIRDAQPELDALVTHYFPPVESAPVARPAAVSRDDAAIVDKLLADPRTARLWLGDLSDHAGDWSAGDLALCSHLAFFTGNDPARIDGLFRRSGLMREKFDSPRGDSTYGDQTIRRAIGN